MTGRQAHDALLRVLTSAELRRGLAAGEAGARLGPEAAVVLGGADADRVQRMARFMARHFYRERIVRLFAASRALARRRGHDPLTVLDTPEFAAILDTAEVGSAATAERVAALVEGRLAPAVADLLYGPDLVAYEGALFRAESGPRRWRVGDGVPGGVPVRSAHARVVALDWDVARLAAAVRRGDPAPPPPPRGASRLLVALAADGRVTTVRCPDGVERFLAALDGTRSAAEAARDAGLDDGDVSPLLRRLTAVGAVEWRAAADRAAP